MRNRLYIMLLTQAVPRRSIFNRLLSGLALFFFGIRSNASTTGTQAPTAPSLFVAKFFYEFPEHLSENEILETYKKIYDLKTIHSITDEFVSRGLILDTKYTLNKSQDSYFVTFASFNAFRDWDHALRAASVYNYNAYKSSGFKRTSNIPEQIQKDFFRKS